MVLTIILLTVLASLVNLWFYLGPARRLDAHLDKKSSSTPTFDSVDILLAARNEEENLHQWLPMVLAQDCERHRVVVVNDNSTDDSQKILSKYSETHPQLHVLSAFAKTTPGKKAALSQAIDESNADWILATDADCEPVSTQWAKQMLQTAGTDTEIVLGFSPYRKQAGWLNRWIRFEALYTAAQYLSATLAGRPYMGVGRNMLYSRDLYTRIGGFASHAHLAGGDDDLLVNEGATATNTRICIDPEAWIYTQPHTSWSDYLRQKTRHLSVSTAYKKSDQLWLGMLAASHVAHFIGVLVLLGLGTWQTALLIYSVRLAVVWWRMRNIAVGLGEGDLSPMLPLLDAGTCVYYVRFSLAALFPSSGKKTW
ncbi:MAG: glycosyltransferase [Saprospiraceae bacterium]